MRHRTETKEIVWRTGFGLRVTFFYPRHRALLEWDIDNKTSWINYSPAEGELLSKGDLVRQMQVGERSIFYLGACVGDYL
jgi:hypothetical protein